MARRTRRTPHSTADRRARVRIALAAAAAGTFFCAANAPAGAARPMVTDDARIVGAGSCQLESWVRRNRGSTEYWALPGCNLAGNLELTVGGALTRDEGTRATAVVLQGKTVFRQLAPGGWAWGLVVGNARKPAQRDSGSGDRYAYLPVTWSVRDDRLFVHANAGWLHDSAVQQDRATWGIGSEAKLTARDWLVAEIYSQDAGRPHYQIGIRHWLVPGRMQIDATVGNRAGAGRDERWFSIGLRLLSPVPR